MLRFDSFRRSSPRRSLSKKTTTAATTTTLRGRVLSVLGLLFVVLMMSYYSLVNRVLEQKKNAEKSSASALLQTQSAGQSIVVTKKASSSSQEGQEAAPNLQQQQQEQLQQHNYTMLPSLVKIYDSPQQQKQQPKATIAYLTSITACPADRRNFRDAAAVLRHSIHLNSIRNHDASSKYDYHMYAILHPDAAECAADFGKIGYTVLLRDTPVALADIQNEKYVQRLINPNAGCCAEKVRTYVRVFVCLFVCEWRTLLCLDCLFLSLVHVLTITGGTL